MQEDRQVKEEGSKEEDTVYISSFLSVLFFTSFFFCCLSVFLYPKKTTTTNSKMHVIFVILVSDISPDLFYSTKLLIYFHRLSRAGTAYSPMQLNLSLALIHLNVFCDTERLQRITLTYMTTYKENENKICVSLCRWVRFSGAVLFCRPHQQSFTHSGVLQCYVTCNGAYMHNAYIHVCVCVSEWPQK